MGSKSRSVQEQNQQTIQTDRRVGASDNAVVATEGARLGSTEVSAGRDLLVQSLDPETIQGAFGLTDNVVNQLSALANNSVVGSQNLAEKLSSSASGTLERVTSGFGNQLAELSQAQATGGLSNLTKFIPWIIAAVVAVIYFRRPKK